MKTLLLVPPDTRPPTLHFPARLAESVGLRVLTPPTEALPILNLPGSHEALAQWLVAHAPEADILIVSLETLTLGGMIPARRVSDSLRDAEARLGLLRQLKSLKPDLRILASGVIVRVAHDNDPLEEKPYYGEYGTELRAYSEAFDRYSRHGTPEDEWSLQRAIASIPHKVLEDWLATRKRNHQLHLGALELTQEGIIEHLCLTLDDTSPYGLAAHDRRALEARTDILKLWERVDIYPGADEVPVTLLARAMQAAAGRVYVRYSSVNGANAELLYEDRPAGELVKAHLRAAGLYTVDTLAEADWVLAVNTPALKQAGVQPDVATVDTAARHLPEFVDFISRCVGEGKRVAIADIAYPNGGEARFVTMLEASVPLRKLAGYSGWNTAGNALGGAIAMGALSGRVQKDALFLEVLFNRFVDDYLYQGIVRAEIRSLLQDPSPFDLGKQKVEAEKLVDEHISPLAQSFWEQHFSTEGLELSWSTPKLAWPRLFTGVFPFTVEERA